MYFGGVTIRYAIASSKTTVTEVANHFHLSRQALMKLSIVIAFSMILLGDYLNTSTAIVVRTDMADSQNDALVTSPALAVA